MRSEQVRGAQPRSCASWWALGALVAVALVSACGPENSETDLSAPTPSTAAGGSTSTTAPPATTAAPPEGLVAEDLALLESLAVAVEEHVDAYERELFSHWDDADADGCDTRCAVLAAQQLPDGGWFSEWDGATEYDSSQVHVDHVVALAEVWRSGAHAWTPAQRDAFADDRANLLAVSASSNLRKGDKDAATWFPSRHEANCRWARTTVRVKAAWSLTVDPAERDALANLLRSCG